MKEIDADLLKRVVSEAKNIIIDYGNYNPNDYSVEQLCVVAYENSLDVVCKYADLIDPEKFDWTAMIMIMVNDCNDKLTPLSADEVHRLQEVFPEQLGEAMAYLSISRNTYNDFKTLSIEFFESGVSMTEVITTMANGRDIGDVITYVYNTIYTDFYKFLDNK